MISYFILIIILLIFIEYKIYKKIITPFSAMAVPYLLILPVNNFFMTQIGFFEISDSVITIILWGLIFVFVGSVFANFRRTVANKKKVIRSEKQTNELNYYKYNKMLKYTIIINILGLLKLFNGLRLGGFGYFSQSENEGYMLRGLVGHLLLSLYPLLPILIYYWLQNKKRIMYLICPLITLIFYFFSYVKYHVISCIVLIYFFIVFKNRKYLIKGTLLIVMVLLISFLANYYFGFLASGLLEKVDNTFYFTHFWKYIGGSIIHDNVIFSHGINANWGGVYKVGMQLFALPNMLFSGVLGYKPFFNSLESDLDYILVGNMGERSNTVDLIGFMYPSTFDTVRISDYLIFGMFFIVLGFIGTKLFNKAYDRLENYSYLISTLIFVVFFFFLSFFGVYGVFSLPWELLIWSWLILKLFVVKNQTHIEISFVKV